MINLFEMQLALNFRIFFFLGCCDVAVCGGECVCDWESFFVCGLTEPSEV